jgi:hypothetical protein
MAGSGRRVFAPGEVLTASNTMNYLMDQTVMNFAGTAARGSAIGTAVAEGMVSYLADTNDVQVYDGADWNDLAYISDVTATSGLVPIIPSSITISGGTATVSSTGAVTYSSGTTGLTINGVFTSAYRNYVMVYSGSKSNNAANDFLLYRLTSSGTQATSSYNQASAAFASSSASLQNLGGNNASSLLAARIYSSGSYYGGSITIYQPNENAATKFTGMSHGTTLNDDQQIFNSGVHYAVGVYDGIYLFPTGFSIFGVIAFYGFND